MDLVVVQLDLRRPQPKAAEQIDRAITGVRSRYRDLPFLLGTVEYQVYKYLLGHGVQARLFTEELTPEVEEALFEEAQRKAEEMAESLGQEESLRFRGINLFNIILYDLTIHIASILRTKHFVQPKKTQPGVIVLFVSSSLGKVPNPDLPVVGTIRIGAATGLGPVGTAFRLLSRFWRKLPKRGHHEPRFVQEQYATAAEGRRVLFATIDNESGNCAEPLVFVLKELRKKPEITSIVAADNQYTHDYLKQRDFVSSVFSYSESLKALRHWLKSSRSFKRKASELVARCGSGSADAAIASAVSQCFVNFSALSRVYSRILWLEALFERGKPRVVVAFPFHSHIARIAVGLAHLRKVPTLSFIPTWPFGLKPGGDFLAFRVYNDVDLVLVPGEDCRSALVKGGVEPKKVLPIGNPKLDSLPKMNAAADKAHVCELFGTSPTDLIFLVASYVLVPGTIDWVRALARQLKSFPQGFKLIIKPHPDEGTSEYERALQDENFTNAVVSKDLPLYSLLNVSDIVLTGMSTVGSEAVLFNKPLICLNFSNVPYSVRYDEAGVALLVKTEEQILPTIGQVLYNPKVKAELEAARKRFRDLYAYRIDGCSSERFVSVIAGAIH